MGRLVTQKLAALAAVAGTFALALPCFAAADAAARENGRIYRDAEIVYADLDLTSDADVARLQARIAAAAKAVCGTENSRDLRRIADHKRCLAEVRSSGERGMTVAIASARLAHQPAIAANDTAN